MFNEDLFHAKTTNDFVNHRAYKKYCKHCVVWVNSYSQFTIHVAVYVLVRYSKKNAARCDTHCELYDSVSRSIFERIMYCRNISERVSVSVAITFVWAMRRPSMSVWYYLCLCALSTDWQAMCTCMQFIDPVCQSDMCTTGPNANAGWSEFSLCMWTWDQACTPAEFKHIDKRRKTHNAERLQSLRMNED